MEGEGKKLWVADPDHGFRLGKLIDIGHDTLTIEPFDSPGRVSYINKTYYNTSLKIILNS